MKGVDGEKLHTWWPPEDAPGRYLIRCSCGRWEFTGTAREITVASRKHDDSPGRSHIVHIQNGGRPVTPPR
jgi:hypothetical protein